MSIIDGIVIHKKELLYYGLLFAILFLFSSFPLTRGDNTTQSVFDELKSQCMSKTTDVKTYENGALGISILYPSGWNVTGPNSNPSYSVVNFESPCSVVNIVVETLGRTNVTLNEYARAATDKLNSYGLFHNITKNNAVLAGNPAQKLEYFMKRESASEFILPSLISQFFTIKDGKAYIITYNRVWPFADAPVSSMIKSFKLSAAHAMP